ncbi:MAG: antibiotic biosynthesis monooxygenase, partial [Marmoricola sp.]
KQMVIIFMGFFPLSLAVNSLVPHTPLATWPLVLRVFATILVMTPLMTYVVLPWITQRMSGWLHR